MTTNAYYLNIVKFLTMAFVLGFAVYASNANEVVMDIDPFPSCVECRSENPDPDRMRLSSEDASVPSSASSDQPKISPKKSGMISMAVLNPDLTDFDSVRFAIVEVADLEIAAEYLTYSLKDINHDDKTDLVFYFSTRDLIPPTSAIEQVAHDACLFVDILKTDKTTRNFSLCEHSLFLSQDKI